MTLNELRDILEEEQYPFFEDSYLQEKILETDFTVEGAKNELIVNLLSKKTAIPEIRLGDITIPSPKEHFMVKITKYSSELEKLHRKNMSGIMVRADGR